MNKLSHEKKIRISNLNDLKIVKTRCVYDVMLQEQSVVRGVNQFGSNFRISVINSFRSLTRKMLFMGIVKLSKKISRR